MNNTNQNRIEWHNRNVYRDRKYEHLVSMLVEEKQSTAIFEYKKELMIFAAMVGYSFNSKKPLSNDKIPITLGTYANSEDDGFIYLLALMETRDAICLKDSHPSDFIRVFEEYCNGGLDIIDNWFNTPQGRADSLKLDTLEKKLLEQLETTNTSDSCIELDIVF